MARMKYSSEDIVKKLREADILLSQGKKVTEAIKQIGISVDTYHRWRREYGGMKVEQTKRLKELEKENARLKRLVADLSLDKAMLEEVNKGNF